MTALETGQILSTTLPAGQRAYYEAILMATLRKNSIFVPYCITKEDFGARAAAQMIYSEVFDTSPNWNALNESDVWLTGAHLDSRQITIGLERHGDVMKFSDYTELTNYWNSGDFTGLVKGKLGQNVVDHMDILAMNAHLAAPNVMYAGTATSIYDLAATELYDPDLGGLARTHLEELGIPGIANVDDSDAVTVVALTSPRVIHDIRTGVVSSTNKWLETIKYTNPALKMRHEAGAWDGVRYMKSDRLRLMNYGLVSAQSALSGAHVVGQGAQATFQGYSVGQSGATAYATVDSSASFAVGDIVTVHSHTVYEDDGNGAYAPSLDDGTQETMVVAGVPTGARLAFTRPFMKPHANDDWVTKGVNLSPTIILGGPSVVYAVGERPNIIFPPKIDDNLMINRIGWRAFVKFAMFRPEWVQVIWSAITFD